MPENESQASGPGIGRAPRRGGPPGPPGQFAYEALPGERFAHEVLAVVLQVRGNSLHVLLWQRGAPPFEWLWALPGGPLGADERLGTSLGRHLATKVDLTDIAYLEQLETRSDPGRDPRDRVLATAYLALVSADVEPRIPADTAWHRVQDLPPTAFDHGSIAESGRDRLRAKLTYTNIGFALAPDTFTVAQLRDIYAASAGHPVSATNLQRVLTRRGVIEATPAAARPTSAGGRPATLYRFAARTLVVTNPFAAFRPPSRRHGRIVVPLPDRCGSVRSVRDHRRALTRDILFPLRGVGGRALLRDLGQRATVVVSTHLAAAAGLALFWFNGCRQIMALPPMWNLRAMTLQNRVLLDLTIPATAAAAWMGSREAARCAPPWSSPSGWRRSRSAARGNPRATDGPG